MALSGPIAVIGSGPAGVSAARPLIEAGLPVTMLDAGVAQEPAVPQTRPSLAQMRASHPDAWRYLVGEDLRGMRLMPELSPKLRMAAGPENFTAFTTANAIRPDGFSAVGCLAPGGLSNIWGAVCFAYDAADMAGWTIGPADLAASYRKISARIGISGPQTDELDREAPPLVLQPPLPLSPLEAGIAAAYARHRGSSGFRVGRTRMAVLSAEHRGRIGCALDNACMLGCAQGSIYASSQEIPELMRAANAAIERGFVVERLLQKHSGWTIRGRDRTSGTAREFQAAKIILAAGALASARLGLEAAGAASETVRLENSPGVACAVLFPRAVGSTLPTRAFGLTQLSFGLPLGSNNPADEIIGSLYPAGAMSTSEFLARMPLTRPGGIGLFREMIPALMVGLAFFPGRYSNTHVHLRARPDGTSELLIEGGHAAEFTELVRVTFRRLRRHFLTLGGIVLPGSLQIMQPGADVHYAGPLAMGQRSNHLGEINGAPGVHVVDGAALPTMAARNPTLTIMANADRIATALATAWRK